MIETVQQGLEAEGFKVSTAKLCKWFEVPRRSYYYKSVKAKPKLQERFVEPIKEMIEENPLFGYRTVAHLLGFNKNTVQRIFQIKRWQVRQRPIGFRPRVDEMDFVGAKWIIPAQRMKARRPHVIYLPDQAMDIMIALKTCAGGSNFILPSRYEGDKGMSNNTLNRVITVTVEHAKKKDLPLDDFTVHDLRRTGSTLLHEAGFNTDWIEKCLAHEQKGVRAVYNKAEYADQRKDMLQQWANMVDAWIAGKEITPIHRPTRAAA